MTMLLILATQAVWFLRPGGGLGDALYLLGAVLCAATVLAWLWDAYAIPPGLLPGLVFILYGTLLMFGLLAIPDPRAGGMPVVDDVVRWVWEWTPPVVMVLTWGLGITRVIAILVTRR